MLPALLTALGIMSAQLAPPPPMMPAMQPVAPAPARQPYVRRPPKLEPWRPSDRHARRADKKRMRTLAGAIRALSRVTVKLSPPTASNARRVHDAVKAGRLKRHQAIALGMNPGSPLLRGAA